MNESILITIKKMLGLDASYNAFDIDIITFINSAFMVLKQIGVKADEGFMITGYDETWTDVLDGYETAFEVIKTYIYLRVRILFDPPSSSVVLTSYENLIKEYEWRINILYERSEET